jgi:fused signal recognition particle receptor
VAGKSLGDKIRALFSSSGWTDEIFEELEDLLVEGDLGALEAMRVSEELQKRVKKERPQDREALIRVLKTILFTDLKVLDLQANPQVLNVFLILGVNGVGKTTTLAKMARYYRDFPGITPVLSAGDTFRAAAVEQLQTHGERLGVRVVSQNTGADPGAVIYDTLESARARGENLVLADTAGRMHNKSNLIRELQKIDKIVSSRAGEANYKKLLVVDATTGQNGYTQAETFHEAVGVDGVILTKYDSTAKGGIAMKISRDLGLPFCFLGTGESYDKFHKFDADLYLDTLLGLKD